MNVHNDLVIGDRVSFVRQACGYPDIRLEGVVVGFNYVENTLKNRTYVAHVFAECEYGSALPYNHTVFVGGCTKL